MWVWDLYKALRSGAAGVKPLKVESRGSAFGFGGSTAVYEEDKDASDAAASPSPAPRTGARWFDSLRLPLGRRRLMGKSNARQLQVQKYPCARPKVTF
jgi:hypothetical protein